MTGSTATVVARSSAQAGGSAPQSDTVGWAALSDSTLWATIVRTDTVVVVGLKEPGSQRGVERGRSVVSRARWTSAIQALGADTRNRLVSSDTVRLPFARLKPADVAALAAIRRLPFVDYVEPNFVPVVSADVGFGCDWSGSSGGSGDSPFEGQLTPSIPSGDNVSSTYFTSNTYFGSNWLYSGSDGMNVANAWHLSSGAGVTIGITDTGLDISPSSEFGSTYFASGQSSGRSSNVIQSGAPTCSHGTRIAGLATAPMNGRLVSGVAYKSNLVSVRHSDGVVPGELPAGDALLTAGLSGPKVIVMAWALLSYSTFVSDVIDYFHYTHDIMFVGAAGTCTGIGWCYGNDNTAMFPASKEEVLAVTGANHDGSRPEVHDFGNKSGVVAYTSLATVGLTSGIVTIRGSSGATGFVAGAAALVRARNPSYSARQAMDAIMWSSGIRCGAPLAWRDAMINVSAAVGGACVSHMFGDITYYIHPWNLPSYSPVDYWVRTLRSSAQFVPGGSGSYAPQWAARPEQEVVTSVDGNVTDSFGNLFWQSRRSIRFLPAWDGAPYLTEVEASVLDGPFGTADRRSMQVLVCSAPNNCYQTTRGWPTPPPPPPLSVSISGPTSVAIGYGYTWTASTNGGYGNVTYSWTAGSYSGTSSSLYGSFCANGTVTLTVTDGNGTVSASLPVNASENEPPPQGGQYAPC